MTRLHWLYLSLVLVVIASVPLMFAESSGVLVQAIIVLSMLQALAFWVRTNLVRPTDPHRLLPPYMLMGAALMFHIIEEYNADFGGAIGALVGSPWDLDGFVSFFVIYMPLLWIGGMVLVAIRHPLGGYMAWFLVVGMIFGEWTHLGVFPLLREGQYTYFPGMWTALLPMIPATWALHVMRTDDKEQRTHQRSDAGPQRAALG